MLPLSDIANFNTKYFIPIKVYTDGEGIKSYIMVWLTVREIIKSTELVDYLLVHHGINIISPAGLWCQKDVVLTSMRRDDVASTLIRRHFGTKCSLGPFNQFFFLSLSLTEEDFPGLGTTTEQTTATSSTSGFTDNFIVGIAIQSPAVHFVTADMTTNSASAAVTVGLSGE